LTLDNNCVITSYPFEALEYTPNLVSSHLIFISLTPQKNEVRGEFSSTSTRLAVFSLVFLNGIGQILKFRRNVILLVLRLFRGQGGLIAGGPLMGNGMGNGSGHSILPEDKSDSRDYE